MVRRIIRYTNGLPGSDAEQAVGRWGRIEPMLSSRTPIRDLPVTGIVDGWEMPI
jgi:hypothetical protein